MTRSRRTLALTAGLVVVVLLGVVGAAGWWFLLRDDSPERANIDTAAETLGEDGDDQGAAPGDLAGNWAVDRTVGSFDDFSGTWAGYRFDEELGGIGANTAAGRTPDVMGTATVDADRVTAVDVEVNLTTLRSDDGRRDGALRSRGLQTDQFPTATFRLNEPLDLPDDVGPASRVSTTATGELTVHGTTREVTVDLDVTLDGTTAGVVGSAPVSLSEFGIEPPTSTFVLSVADEGLFEFQIFFTRE